MPLRACFDSLQRDQFRGPLIQNSTTGLLLGPLHHLNSVAQQLLQSLSPPHTKPPHPPSITALAEADAALARLLHAEVDVLALENSWRNVIVQLEEGRRDLEAIIAEGDVRLDAIEQAKAGAIPYPNSSSMHKPPPPLFFPPFPNEEKMRRGHLNAEEPLGPLAPSPSPEPHRGQAANPYRPMDNRPPQQMFDLDLDLNPDL
ncbi:hypothetical protein EDB84DRAFT_1591093 [Lactarius hengduanensis]|nr:hypothetical protein EDB84DRAFT_1591093 [Lactarius hengduanensis]